MKLLELKNHCSTIREELDKLPQHFILDIPRPTGHWEGSDYLNQIASMYLQGASGWLKGGQEHLIDKWISWPLIWQGKSMLGNCLLCPNTYRILSQIKGIYVAGFSLLKGESKLEEHIDPVGDKYRFTYHLGLKCPDGCILYKRKSNNVIEEITEEDGKHIVFSSRFPHWAENKSKEDRIILYIEYYVE